MEITVIRSGDFIIPTDEAYTVLAKHNLRQTRIAVPLFDTLTKLMFEPLGIKIKYLRMQDVFNEWLDKVEANWSKIPSTRIHTSKGMLRLETTHPAVYAKAKAVAPKVEDAFDRFFTRYGAQYSVTYSETPSGKVRIACEYRFGMKRPVIAIMPEAVDVVADAVTVTMGFTRIVLSTDRSPMSRGKYKTLSVQAKAGDNWKPVHTGRFLPGEIHMDKGLLNFLIENSPSFMQEAATSVVPLDDKQMADFIELHKKRLKSLTKTTDLQQWHRSSLSKVNEMTEDEKSQLRKWHKQQLEALGDEPEEEPEPESVVVMPPITPPIPSATSADEDDDVSPFHFEPATKPPTKH